MAGNDAVILVKELQKVIDKFVKPADASATEERSSSRSSICTLQELKSKIHEVEEEEPRNPKQKEKPQFPKVAKMLGGSDDNYEPKLISLGPYHHGKAHLEKGETLKLRWAATYLSFWDSTVDYFYTEIKKSITELKNCYDPQEFRKEYSDEEFTMMMLVDGCSLLFYILYVSTYWLEEYFDIRYQDLSLLHQDVLLLENQLPFQLLIKLMEPSSFLMHICQKFIRMNKLSPQEKKPHFFPIINQLIINWQAQKSRKPAVEELPCHLLDLFRRNILGDEGRSNQKRTGSEKGNWKYMEGCIKSDFREEVAMTNMEGAIKGDFLKEVAMKGDFLSFRNVKELMAAGIRIKPSHKGHLRNISFSSNGITACLRIPPITIDNSTKAIFMNLIAYEMTSEVDHDFISYLRFLDSLIDHADDVEELQSVQVLQNNLGNHEEVAQFFNTVSANLESNLHAYREVREKIREHGLKATIRAN